MQECKGEMVEMVERDCNVGPRCHQTLSSDLTHSSLPAAAWSLWSSQDGGKTRAHLIIYCSTLAGIIPAEVVCVDVLTNLDDVCWDVAWYQWEEQWEYGACPVSAQLRVLDTLSPSGAQMEPSLPQANQSRAASWATNEKAGNMLRRGQMWPRCQTEPAGGGKPTLHTEINWVELFAMFFLKR